MATATTKKIDFKKEWKHLYKPPVGKVVEVDVPAMNYLAGEGKGNPNKPESGFGEIIECLYGISYGLKFMFKDQPKPKGYFEYVVPPMQGFWWAEDMSAFKERRHNEWLWKIMIMVPEFYTEAMILEAQQKLKDRKNPPAIDKIMLERIEEGLSAQLTHIGSYNEEDENIAKIHQYIDDNGFEINGHHHEIYISDPRRTAEERLKTVIRYPIKKK